MACLAARKVVRIKALGTFVQKKQDQGSSHQIADDDMLPVKDDVAPLI